MESGSCFSFLRRKPRGLTLAGSHCLWGRYIQRPGWDSHREGGVPSPFFHPSFPSPRHSSPAQLPVAGGPSDATRSRPARSTALATPHPESSGLWRRRTSCAPAFYCPPLSSRLSTVHPCTFSRKYVLPDLQRPYLFIPPLPGRENRFRVHTPRSLAVGGGRTSGSAEEVLPFLPAAGRGYEAFWGWWQAARRPRCGGGSDEAGGRGGEEDG